MKGGTHKSIGDQVRGPETNEKGGLMREDRKTQQHEQDYVG